MGQISVEKSDLNGSDLIPTRVKADSLGIP